MEDNTNVSVIIIYSFVFLFFVFLFLQEGQIIVNEPTGHLLFDTLDGSSSLTIIILIISLILIAGFGFFVYKKIKSKKNIVLEVPKPPQLNSSEKSISDLDKDFNIPALEKSQEAQDAGNEDEEINKLFSDSQPKEVQQDKIEIKENKINLDELRKLVRILIKKNYNKNEIVKYLTSKKYNISQIRESVNIINEENISVYIKNSLSQGFSKKDIINALIKSGWNKEDIVKHF